LILLLTGEIVNTTWVKMSDHLEICEKDKTELGNMTQTCRHLL